VFSPTELNSFSDTMAERELRMRKGIDDFLEGWKDANDGDGESDEELDEIEHNAKEYLRLLPY
jgi:hypothetical protein